MLFASTTKAPEGGGGVDEKVESTPCTVTSSVLVCVRRYNPLGLEASVGLKLRCIVRAARALLGLGFSTGRK